MRTPAQNGAPRLLLACADENERGLLAASVQEFCACVVPVGSVREGLRQIRLHDWDVVVSDLMFEDGPGTNMALQLAASDSPAGIVLVGNARETSDTRSAMRFHPTRFLARPLNIDTLRDTITSCYLQSQATRAERNKLRRCGGELAAAREQAAFLQEKQAALQQSVIDSLLAALAVREQNTVQHSLRLQAYARHMARAVQYPDALLPHLEHAALLHDVGKIGLGTELLFKPGSLPIEDLRMMRVHVEFGEQYLNGIDFLRPAALIVRHHHERYDGSGYPDGLRGQNIPLGSRILTIADALESLTSHQQYRAARSMHEAIEEIGRWSGRQFDPLLVTNFVRVSGDTWSQIREQAEASSLKPMTTDFRQEPGLPAVV